MSPELQAELIRRYPKFFREPVNRASELANPGSEECLLFDMGPFDERGIECGDGWFATIDRLSCACEYEIAVLVSRGVSERSWPRVAQVKEKFGGLRFYVKGRLSSQLRRQISQAHADGGESFRTCERCGATGKLRDGAWKRTYCDNCYAESEANRRHSAQ